MTNSKAPLGDGALSELITGFVGVVSAVASCKYTTMLPQSRCPNRIVPSAPPCHQQFGCGQCGRWLRRLPRPRTVAQEGRR